MDYVLLLDKISGEMFIEFQKKFPVPDEIRLSLVSNSHHYYKFFVFYSSFNVLFSYLQKFGRFSLAKDLDSFNIKLRVDL